MSNTNITPLRKPAEAAHPIHELISERWSPRAFSTRPVEHQKLHSIFEAARWAASAANFQPWSFIFAVKEHAEDHARILETLVPNNAGWAKEAPVLIITVAKLYDFAGREYHSYYDLGMAVENLVIQAGDLGLVVHQMGGFDADKARELFNIPAGYNALTVIALGYPGSADDLHPVLRERELAPRERKPLEEFVFEGSWKQAAPDAQA
ncbi:nitroreductase family protein [Dictyobacter arantiisoli]|uniref:Oxidoreductase n=1 Tax=Dictyobacter arantiisoli TaxID=2014874 RepID=A0A5A5TIQ5_9CHLR|nr:nitroreductase family protein [Dictyobacter arantiisoli]GCF10824.1 oxidoreductase [Dictyobacter arantiisoli]